MGNLILDGRPTNFSDYELQCPCCKRYVANTDRLRVLQFIRDHLNLPVYINSGDRCKRHNKFVGGSKNSRHLIDKGLAADPYVKELSTWELADIIRELQIKNPDIFSVTGKSCMGLGCYPLSNTNYVHLDIGRNKEVRWIHLSQMTYYNVANFNRYIQKRLKENERWKNMRSVSEEMESKVRGS